MAALSWSPHRDPAQRAQMMGKLPAFPDNDAAFCQAVHPDTPAGVQHLMVREDKTNVPAPIPRPVKKGKVAWLGVMQGKHRCSFIDLGDTIPADPNAQVPQQRLHQTRTIDAPKRAASPEIRRIAIP